MEGIPGSATINPRFGASQAPRDANAIEQIQNDLRVIIDAQGASLRMLEDFLSRTTGQGFPNDASKQAPQPAGSLSEVKSLMQTADGLARQIRAAAERLENIG